MAFNDTPSRALARDGGDKGASSQLLSYSLLQNLFFISNTPIDPPLPASKLSTLPPSNTKEIRIPPSVGSSHAFPSTSGAKRRVLTLFNLLYKGSGVSGTSSLRLGSPCSPLHQHAQI